MRRDGDTGRPWFVRRLSTSWFDRLRTRLPAEPGPLLTYAILFAAFDIVVLQGYQQLTGRVAVFLENPLWLLTPAAIVAAAVATESLHDRYDRTLLALSIDDRTTDPGRFARLVPDRLSVAFVAIGTAYTLFNAVSIVGIEQIYAVEGIAGVVGFVVVIPLGYVPVAATFLATYASVEVLLPRRLEASDVGLYFLDPENLGGMRPVGELVKWAYYYVMLGLLVYAVATYGPHLLGGAFRYTAYEPPGLLVNVAFTALWIAAVGTMVYGIHVLHRFMLREKREELERLDERAREVVDHPWNVGDFTVAEEAAADFEDLRRRMGYVAATSEYPATFTMWSQVVVGVALPKVIQLVLRTL